MFYLFFLLLTKVFTQSCQCVEKYSSSDHYWKITLTGRSKRNISCVCNTIISKVDEVSKESGCDWKVVNLTGSVQIDSRPIYGDSSCIVYITGTFDNKRSIKRRRVREEFSDCFCSVDHKVDKETHNTEMLGYYSYYNKPEICNCVFEYDKGFSYNTNTCYWIRDAGSKKINITSNGYTTYPSFCIYEINY